MEQSPTRENNGNAVNGSAEQLADGIEMPPSLATMERGVSWSSIGSSSPSTPNSKAVLVTTVDLLHDNERLKSENLRLRLRVKALTAAEAEATSRAGRVDSSDVQGAESVLKEAEVAQAKQTESLLSKIMDRLNHVAPQPSRPRSKEQEEGEYDIVANVSSIALGQSEVDVENTEALCKQLSEELSVARLVIHQKAAELEDMSMALADAKGRLDTANHRTHSFDRERDQFKARIQQLEYQLKANNFNPGNGSSASGIGQSNPITTTTIGSSTSTRGSLQSSSSSLLNTSSTVTPKKDDATTRVVLTARGSGKQEQQGGGGAGVESTPRSSASTSKEEEGSSRHSSFSVRLTDNGGSSSTARGTPRVTMSQGSFGSPANSRSSGASTARSGINSSMNGFGSGDLSGSGQRGSSGHYQMTLKKDPVTGAATPRASVSPGNSQSTTATPRGVWLQQSSKDFDAMKAESGTPRAAGGSNDLLVTPRPTRHRDPTAASQQ